MSCTKLNFGTRVSITKCVAKWVRGSVASIFLFSILNSTLTSYQAQANVGEAFGFGSRVAGLAGIGTVGNAGAFSAYHNPAALGVPSDKRLLFSWGMVYMQPNFLPINNVVTQNLFNADADTVANVNTTYRNTAGQELGLSYQLFPEYMNITAGLVAFVPYDALAYMDTGESYVPEYFMYRARTQRPQVEFAVGANLGKGFHFGAGVHFGFSLTGNASVFINTITNTTSSMRFIASMQPKAGPYFGLLYKSQSESDPDRYNLGAVFRFPVSSLNTMVLSSAARVFGNFAAVDFNFTALSTLFYDPMALELGGAYKFFSWWKAYAQVDYQFWSAFQAPALVIQQPQTTNCSGSGCTGGSLNISPGSFPAYQYVDVVVPRFGEEFYLNEITTIRLGYAYRPSILGSVSNGNGNYLDPPKHMASLGLGLNYKHFLGFEATNQIDFHLAYQYLIQQTISKTAGNEVGNAADPKIGSPGYVAGGSVYGGGVSLSLLF